MVGGGGSPLLAVCREVPCVVWGKGGVHGWRWFDSSHFCQQSGASVAEMIAFFF